MDAAPAQPPVEAIAAARLWLAAREPILARAHAALPTFLWRTRRGGYAGLLQLITAQQVSTASAAAIWGRLEAALGEVSVQAVLAREEADLRALGLSKPKARYALAIARAYAEGRADIAGLAALDDDAALTVLTSLTGVGRWTAEVYLLFCEGRLDAFPAGDLAVQEAVRALDGAAVRPDEKALYARAEAWRPYRGVAAHMLWAYYAMLRRRDGAPPMQETRRGDGGS